MTWKTWVTTCLLSVVVGVVAGVVHVGVTAQRRPVPATADAGLPTPGERPAGTSAPATPAGPDRSGVAAAVGRPAPATKEAKPAKAKPAKEGKPKEAKPANAKPAKEGKPQQAKPEKAPEPPKEPGRGRSGRDG